MIVSLIIVILLIVIIEILRILKKKKILSLIKKQELDSLENELNKITTRMLVPSYNRENLLLNCYLMQKNNEKINIQFEKLWNVSKKDIHNQEFLTKMFNHYAFSGNKKQSKRILDEIKRKINKPNIVYEAEMIYEIFFKKSSKYIDDLKEKMNVMENEQKGMAAYFISVQYRNMNNVKKVEEYEQISKQYFSL